MKEILHPALHNSEETVLRTIVKTVTYRAAILILDFIALYLFTGKITVALGFTVVSNAYTTLGYFLQERIWNKIKWGKIIYKKVDE